jgi:hypothetical protein
VTSEAVQVQRSDQLPALTWLLRVASVTAELTCGSGVETADNYFFEGAWAGSFEESNFDNDPNVFGSGARCIKGEWILVPPSHTLEAIYAIRLRNGIWFVSNSLAFLLESSGAKIKYSWPGTLVEFVGIVEGVHRTLRSIPTTLGTLHVLHFHNAVLADKLRLVPKTPEAPFDSFESYLRYLERVMQAVAKNASSEKRRARYRVMATISSGYDSPACAAIARLIGCQEGVTVGRSRDGQDDNGEEIGKRLGFRVDRVEHPYLNGKPVDDRTTVAEFFATGMQGVDIIFAAMDGVLNRRLLITGFHGDKVWDLHGKANTVLERGDISGSGLTEFRLRQDFIHLPLPFVGATQHPSIRDISRSTTMRPFCVGGDYDRPIPRRIAEEGGVPRQYFGINKKAICTYEFDIGPSMREEIERAQQIEPPRARLIYWMRSVRYRLAMRLHGRSYEKARYLVLGYPWQILSHLRPFQIRALDWALSVVCERYGTPNSRADRHKIV